MLDRGTVRDVFLEASELPEGERAGHLDRRCGGDAALRAEVESLLAAAGRWPSFFSSPTAGPPGGGGAPPEVPGTRIGHYRLLQEIGQGGFGSVYLAEQEEPVRRRVALKIIKLGMDTRAVISRFEAERQALAMMEHPGIAAVFDAGTTGSGRPYFVMELVQGAPITRYCDCVEMRVAERLRLFGEVCAAVQHAHQKGVIHRDLKPGNVLVAERDGRAHPKIIDFGIAKATRGRLTEGTLLTEFRQFIGTPEYMSPEQTLGARMDVDTRSDIYSLGVMLYELLTGTTPLDPASLREADVADVQRMIREDETPRPSTRFSTLAARADIAAHRRMEPRRLGLLLRGDLDWIVLKALEKDRARRYETAAALAEDVRRFLEHETVSATPPGRAYRVRKFVRRHRGPVITGALVSVALVLGLAGTSTGLLRASWERNRAVAAEEKQSHLRQRAERDRDDAQRVTQFLQVLLRADDPTYYAASGELTLRQVVDRAVSSLDSGDLKDAPDAERALRLTLGKTYADLSRYDEARTQARRAEALLGPEPADPHDRVMAWHIMAVADSAQGRLGEAEATYRKTLALTDREYGADDIDAAYARIGLAKVLAAQERFGEATPLLAQALKTLRSGPPSHRVGIEIVRAMGQQAMLVADQGDAERGAAMMREAVAFGATTLGGDNPSSISVQSNLGCLLQRLGRFGEAEPILRDALERSERILGAHHSQTGTVLSNLGYLELDRHRFSESEALARRALDLLEPSRGEHSDTVIGARSILAFALEGQKKFAESISIRRAIDRSLPDNSPVLLKDRIHSLTYLAWDLRDTGDQDGAETALRRALALASAHWPDGHPLAWYRHWVASSLGHQIAFFRPAPSPPDRLRWLREAEPLLTEAAARIDPPPGERKYRDWAVRDVVALYEWLDKNEPGAGHAATAAQWRERAGPATESAPR